jgi:nucleotide-binding universal stress UspA family protein
VDAIRKILVPTDFSAHADEAFRVACVLAKATRAEVVVFHVTTAPAVAAEAGPLLAEPGKNGSANLWDRFRNSTPTDPQVTVQHEVIVADRPGASHVLDILDRLGCDLIVMGTHGRSWLKHLLFGSVTEEVVRRARCPVMVVKAPAQTAKKTITTSTRAATTVEGR